MRRTALRILFLALPLAGLLSCHHSSVPLHGYKYSFTSSTDGDVLSGKTVKARVFASTDSTRVEYDEGDGVLLPRNTVLISTDGGKSMYVLNSDAKTYYQLTAEQLTSQMMAKLKKKAGPIDVDIANVDSHLTDEGRDNDLESYSTRKYVLRLNYDVHVAVRNMQQTIPSRLKVRVWTTDKIPEKYFEFFTNHSMKTGFDELDQHLARLSADVNGFPLKEVVETDVTIGPLTKHTVQTMVVDDIFEGDIESSLFDLPANYTKVAPNA